MNFSEITSLLSTSFNRGMSLEAIAAMPGHRSLDMTLRYANPRELHQPGAKPQAARSAWDGSIRRPDVAAAS
jgi:hypothetical protein